MILTVSINLVLYKVFNLFLYIKNKKNLIDWFYIKKFKQKEILENINLVIKNKK